MQLLKQEWKKLMTRDGFLLVFCVCFITAFLLLGYSVYNLSYGDDFSPAKYRKFVAKIKDMPEEQRTQYLSEQEEDMVNYSLVAAVEEEWSNVEHYPQFLQKICEETSNGLQGLQKDSYQSRLKNKYRQKYKKLDAQSVSFLGGRGISLFCRTDVMDVIAVLLMMLIVFRLVVWESETGMGCINAASRNGNACLTRTKWLAGWTIAIPILGMLYVYKLFLYSNAYGFKEWGGAIQSLPEFAGVNCKMSVGGFVIVFILHKIIGFLFLYTLLFWMALLGKGAVQTVILQGTFLGISFFLLRGISLSGSNAILRYFSPLQCINQKFVLSGYHAVKVFQYPVSYLGLWHCVMAVIFCIVLSAIARSAIRGGRSDLRWMIPSFVGKRGILKKNGYRAKFGQSILKWEGRKGLFYEGSILVMVLAVLGVIVCYKPPQDQITTSDAYCYREILQNLEGKYTVQKGDRVRRKIEDLERLEKDVEQNGDKYTGIAMQVAQSELKQLNIYREVENYVAYISHKKGAHIVYQKGWQVLIGKRIPGSYLRLCSILAVLIMVLMSARLWGEDEWQQTEVLCRATYAGMRQIGRGKMFWILLYAVFDSVIVYVPWIYQCGQTYSLKDWSASAESLTSLSGISFMNLGSVVLFSYLLRMIYLIVVGYVTKLVQNKLSSQSLTIYTALILCLIPVVLFA